MIDTLWNLLETELKTSNYPPEKCCRVDWGTYWEFTNKRQRNVKKGEKGVRVSVKNLPCPVFNKGEVVTEIDKNGKERPMIRNNHFKKSFFHIDQTEHKGDIGRCNVITFPNKR
jgi:hypothetical protein